MPASGKVDGAGWHVSNFSGEDIVTTPCRRSAGVSDIMTVGLLRAGLLILGQVRALLGYPLYPAGKGASPDHTATLLNNGMVLVAILLACHHHFVVE